MENSEEKKISPRKAILAFLLSAIVPGLGQLYNGQLRKALIFLLGTLTYSIVISVLGLEIHFWVYVIPAIVWTREKYDAVTGTAF